MTNFPYRDYGDRNHKRTVADYSLAYAVKNIEEEYLIHYENIYTYRHPLKLIRPPLLRNILRHYGHDLYLNKPGDMAPKPVELRIWRDIQDILLRERRAENRYSKLYEGRKPEKAITEKFANHLMKPWGLRYVVQD